MKLVISAKSQNKVIFYYTNILFSIKTVPLLLFLELNHEIGSPILPMLRQQVDQ